MAAKKTRNSVVLDSFVKYCEEHPEERFWQALRNWSMYAFIYVSDYPVFGLRDTFYWEGRRREGQASEPTGSN